MFFEHPAALLYTNEGADVFTGGGAGPMDEAPALCQAALRKGCSDLCGTSDCCWWPHVPKGLDLVGFTVYRDTGATERQLWPTPRPVCSP